MRAKPAEQQRSREKRDLLLQALEGLLELKSFQQISVGEVASKAGVSVATVYQRFNNEHAMASILLELYYQRTSQWWSKPNKKQAPACLHEALVQLAEKSWDQMRELHHIMKPAFLFSRERPDLVGAEWKELESTALEGFLGFLHGYREEISSLDFRQSASTVCYLYNYMALGKLLDHDEKQWYITRNRKLFSNELANLAYAYLTLSGKLNG